MSKGVAGVEHPVVTYNEVGTLDVEAPTVACTILDGELDAVTAAAPVDISSDEEGRRGGFLLCFSGLEESLGCFLCSFRESFTSDFFDSLPSLSRCSCRNNIQFDI